MDGNAGITRLATGVNVDNVGNWGPVTYSIPSWQAANTGNNESAVCISGGDSGNQVPITLI
jgi:hypothetical protein